MSLGERQIAALREAGGVYTHHFDRAQDLEPVPIDPDIRDWVAEVDRRYLRAGFSVVARPEDCPLTPAMVLKAADRLGLERAFVPRQYAGGDSLYESDGVNRIIASDAEDDGHRAFQTRNAQALHCDGTLEEIGTVRTSMLFCVRAAGIGGLTTVFNSVGAWVALGCKDPLAATAFLDPAALIRRDVGRSNEFRSGPVFALREGELSSRFSLDNTCDWSAGLASVVHLSKGFTELCRMAAIDSPFYIELKLSPGQGIIFANDRVSHGRTVYTDTPGRPRELLRALFRGRPSPVRSP